MLEQVAEHTGAVAVLLGHTRDDQAETVLLGLTRGSGGRALAGMRRSFDRYRRPLLDVTRRRHGHRLPGRRASSSGTTRTTTTPASPGCGCARPCCRCSSGSSDPASRRRWPAPPTRSATTSTSSTTWPRPTGRGCAVTTARSRSTALARLPAPVRRRVLRLAALAAGSPGLGALPRPRGGPGLAGHRLARPEVDRPARPPARSAPGGRAGVFPRRESPGRGRLRSATIEGRGGSGGCEGCAACWPGSCWRRCRG